MHLGVLLLWRKQVGISFVCILSDGGERSPKEEIGTIDSWVHDRLRKMCRMLWGRCSSRPDGECIQISSICRGTKGEERSMGSPEVHLLEKSHVTAATEMAASMALSLLFPGSEP